MGSLQLRDRVAVDRCRARGEVDVLLGVVVVVVELFGAVEVADVAPPLVDDSVGRLRRLHLRHVRLRRHGRVVPGAVEVVEQRHEALPVVVGVHAAREVAVVGERRIQVEQADDTVTDAGLAKRVVVRQLDDERHAAHALPDLGLLDVRLLAEQPAVVAPQHDDRVVGVRAVLESGQNLTDTRVGEAQRREVGGDEFAPHVLAGDRARPERWCGVLLGPGEVDVGAEAHRTLRGQDVREVHRRRRAHHVRDGDRDRRRVVHVVEGGRREPREVRRVEADGEEERLAVEVRRVVAFEQIFRPERGLVVERVRRVAGVRRPVEAARAAVRRRRRVAVVGHRARRLDGTTQRVEGELVPPVARVGVSVEDLAAAERVVAVAGAQESEKYSGSVGSGATKFCGEFPW